MTSTNLEKQPEKFADLEHDICSLADMVQVLTTLLEDSIKDYKTGSACGTSIKVLLGSKEVRMLSFAWNDVSRRSEELQDRFYKVLGESTH